MQRDKISILCSSCCWWWSKDIASDLLFHYDDADDDDDDECNGMVGMIVIIMAITIRYWWWSKDIATDLSFSDKPMQKKSTNLLCNTISLIMNSNRAFKL